mmetsp:Transcript_129591/g.361093  ORF Transcript_129591/g.361093 Transcript_129591/m.361093 type:complete len:201 (+) Transcript_129591:105-707(+)
MGSMCVREQREYGVFNPAPALVLEPVTLNIYDIGRSGKGAALNRVLRPLGTGAFHCGVEVYSIEWSYSDTSSGEGEGIFCCHPRCCEGHNYCESVPMGGTATSEGDVLRLVRVLQKNWTVRDYDTLRQNCCHFSNEFCHRLGVGSIPEWVMNLAGAGAVIADATDNCRAACCCAAVTNATRVELVQSHPAFPTKVHDVHS